MTDTTTSPPPGVWHRFLDGDVWYSFRRSRVAQIAAVLAL
jgi:hypothetical protein